MSSRFSRTAEQKDTLQSYAGNNQLPIVRRVDVWDLLLEPFLDTEHSLTHQETTLATVRAAGFSQAEVVRIRNSVKAAMLAYNSMHWDWTHLGLFDLLTAARQGLSWQSIKHRLYRKSYHEFYWSAMQVADRDNSERGEQKG